jgi:hypothetical protein
MGRMGSNSETCQIILKVTLTEKRVKIEADDVGKIGIRYVPPQSLQCQG